MAALLAPARLPLSDVQEEDAVDITDYDGHHHPSSSRPHHYWRSDSFARRHGYLHSLALAASESSAIACSTAAAGPGPKYAPFALYQAPAIVAKRRPAAPDHLRSLSKSFISRARMAAAAVDEQLDTAPSSPPELSYSKSSKSSNSSIRSDSSDDDDEPTATKLSHFEDISIEDVGRDSVEDSNLRPESRPTLKRPAPRSAVTMDGTRRVSSPVIGAPPPPRYPPTLRGADALNPIPNGLGLRRVLTSPSAPSFFSLDAHRPSRSPSPSKPFMQNGVSVSPQTLASATPKLSNEVRPSSSSGGMFARRKSWQTGNRRTAKEIEADYNDDDEEVPAEYVLQNVPISPMPGQQRLSQSLSRSQSRSATPSPQRRPSYTNLHSANVPKGAKRPSGPSVRPNGQYGHPRSPRTNRPSTLHHSATTPNFLPMHLHHKQRSKSWTDDLNDEARELSAALEAYTDRLSTEKHGSGTNSLSSSPPEPLFLKERAKSATFELPTVQKGNIMIDPLPISKEKEAVLTRTRPSWLPPKNQKEEKRHLREWGQMMARAAENEKKRALKEKEMQENKDEMRDSIARIWDQHVLPRWELVVKEPRTRELWWRGVTPRSRGVVWQRAIGNDLELSESSFEAALNRASELEENVAEMTPDERSKSKEAAWFDAIARDVATACPHIQDPDQRIPFQRALTDVLKAYTMYRNDVGYVYGTHLVAAMLCLHLRPADAFVSLANLQNRPIPMAFHVHDAAAMSRAYNLVLSTLNYKFTKLHSHLTSSATGLQPHEYLDPIFRCLFTYHLAPELASRVWDIYVFEGDKALVRAAVAVLGKLEGRLYGTREEILDLLGWRNEKVWDLGGEEEFVLAVREAGKVDSKAEVKVAA